MAGKFERRHLGEASALADALRDLGALLLREPEDERAQLRGRVVRTLGAHAGLARVIPTFAELLGELPETRGLEPAHAAARFAEVAAGLLRAIASRERPVVLVLDDAQWGGVICSRLIDATLSATDLRGFVFAMAYREDELYETHPLSLALERWQQEGRLPVRLALGNLASAEIATLLANRFGALGAVSAQGLADLLAPHAAGNPCDTLELAAALLEGGCLGAPGADEAVRGFLATTRVDDVLAARIRRLPGEAVRVLRALGCLGTRTDESLAQAALAMPPSEFRAALDVLRAADFLEDADAGSSVLALANERIRQAAYAGLAQDARARFHLALGRGLDRDASHLLPAAEQFVRAVDAIEAAADCVHVAGVLRRGAALVRNAGDFAASHQMLVGATTLLARARAAGRPDVEAEARSEIDLHLALCNTGRLEEADGVYASIEARGPDALALAEAAGARVLGLANRGQSDEAVELGLRVLHRLGGARPAPAEVGSVPDFIVPLRDWVRNFDLGREGARPEATDPMALACAALMMQLSTVAVLKADSGLMAWLIERSVALWNEHGPSPGFVRCFAHASIVAISFHGDRRTGYLATRHAVDLCEARDWPHEAAISRHLHLLTAQHWFEPLERRVDEAERARAGMLLSGDLRNAAFAFGGSLFYYFECGTTLRRFVEEIETAGAMARRADNRRILARNGRDLAMVRKLALGGEYDRAVAAGLPEGSPLELWYEATWMQVAAAIFGDTPSLSRMSRAALQGQHAFECFYTAARVCWLAGVAICWEIRESGDRGGDAAERERLDTHVEWLRERMIDSPSNFRHQWLHLRAERAWAVGEPDLAARLFDEALAMLDQTQRPWQQAFLTERAARLHLDRGWTWSGDRLLHEARQLYEAWGALAKVARMTSALERPGGAALSYRNAVHRPVRTHEDADMLAFVRTSQALRTERNPQRLQALVEDIVASLVGATKTALHAGSAETGPASVLRYVRRTGKPLIVPDAVADPRFRAEPGLRDLRCCSMLALPVARQGHEPAVLLLENSAMRDAFNASRVDILTLLAGQLVESLESARLLGGLEQHVREQTLLLRDAQARLLEEARRAGMAQIAVNVLHHVGNLLTSVNVSAHLLAGHVRKSRAARLADVAGLVDAHAADYDRFFAREEKGRLLPGYVRQLATALAEERAAMLAELRHLAGNVGDIQNVVRIQQASATRGLSVSALSPP